MAPVYLYYGRDVDARPFRAPLLALSAAHGSSPQCSMYWLQPLVLHVAHGTRLAWNKYGAGPGASLLDQSEACAACGTHPRQALLARSRAIQDWALYSGSRAQSWFGTGALHVVHWARTGACCMQVCRIEARVFSASSMQGQSKEHT